MSSDPRTQRNIAILVAVVAVAVAVGYFAGQSGTPGSAAPPRVGNPAAGAAAGSSNGPAPEAPARYDEPARYDGQERADEPAPIAGERRRQAPSRPRAEPQPEIDEPAVFTAAEAADGDAEPPAGTMQTTTRVLSRVVERVTVPAGTQIVLELVDGASSQSSAVGDEVVARLAEPVRIDGELALPVGTRVEGRVTEVRKLARVGGQAILALAFERVDTGDGGAAIAAFFRREGKSETGKDAATIAGGAAAGAILGNQAKKNDRGKLLGALLGAAAGTAVASRTEGETVELPSGSRLELTLRDDVNLLLDAN